jgi:uncharacterized protein (DUF4415 family)
VQKDETIVRHSAEELREKRARGETLTDWSHVNAMTDEEIEHRATEDERENGPYDWSGPAYRGLPPGIGAPKKQLTVRLDTDIIDWFKSQGKGYQTRMNAVLRQYMEREKPRSSNK